MKKKIIGIAILLSICLMSTIVYGALSGTTQLTANNSTVNPGDEVIVTLRVEDIAGSTVGVAGFEAKLVYDSDIFETVTVSDIDSNWTVENMNPKTLLSIMTTTPVTADTNICTITLKVKEDAAFGDTTIGLTDSKIYNLQETVSTTISDLTISVEEEEVVTNNTTPNNTTPNNTKPNNTTANVIIPQTGISNFVSIIIFSIMVISAISYLNYRKNKVI